MTKSRPKPPSEGCRLLRASGLSLSQIGNAGHVSKPAAAKWIDGKNAPDDGARALLEADPRTRIPRDAWQRAPGTLAGAPPVPATPAAPRPVPQVDVPPPPAAPTWAVDPGYTPPPLPPRGPEAPPTVQYEASDVDLDAPGAARALVVAQIKRLQLDCTRLRLMGGSDDAIRKAEDAELKAAERLAKLAGELNPTEEARLVKSVKWHGIKVAILNALEPFPDALRAVRDALAREEAL